MPKINANGIQLEYETSGVPGAPPVLLIMGLSSQLTRWPEPFIAALVNAGLFVIRYDNRDVGLSTRVPAAPASSLWSAALRARLGLAIQVPYTLDTMAADAVGLLDALGLPSAHIVGVSMGGMIGQLLAAHHGARVRTFVSIMSSSGGRLPQPDWRLQLALLRGPRRRGDRQAAIDATVEVLRRIASPGYPPDVRQLREEVARDIDRAHYPRGMRNHLLAILASGSRTSILGRIAAPTLVLHGADDPLIPVAAAHDLRRRVPGAALEIFPGMGHDLPRALIGPITQRIVEHVRRVDAAPRAAAGQRE